MENWSWSLYPGVYSIPDRKCYKGAALEVFGGVGSNVYSRSLSYLDVPPG